MNNDEFERERAHLLNQINEGLKDAGQNLAVLNRNLSHIIQVGKSFKDTADVWNQFPKK
eukprot:CAMPEP_0184013340 /NCGR_PEP_ID=MMETSP0954-20121128/4956_1 /TAXON_ID=627963 /ORGANISM="Aplanochytrium sp, Strain PBS07" /LENGTH=58 /DNA_ID=CAMNT_0026293513 /DNA_START=233 /DNA_END=409 /DNA_ORIENTATION=+